MPIPILRGDGGGSVKFAEVLEIKNGKNQKQVEDADGKYPIYGSGGIMGWATDYICPAKTVIIGRKGTINNPIYVDSPFWNVDTAFGLVADKSILHPKYLYYFCKHFDFLALNTTVTIPSLTKANLLKIDIPVPDMDEQQYVVRVLDDVENLIEIKTKEKFELDNLVKSRFIEMFDGKYKMVKLGDVVKTTSGGTPSKAHPEYYENGTIPWLTSGEVNAGIITSVKNHITDIGMKNSSAKMVPANSVVIAMYGATAGVTGLIRLDTTTNQAVCSILPSERFVPEYLYYAVASKKEWMISQCQGGGQPNISQGIIKNMDVIDAPIEEQIRFATFVKQTDKLKLAAQKTLSELEILKKSLMQKYFG